MNRRQAIAAMAGISGWAGLYWYANRAQGQAGTSILNASYDATRELYRIINRRFTEQTGMGVRPSHGGSGKQALAVREGLPADVVSLAVWPDLNELAKAKLLDPGWEDRFPNRSLPFTSTIVFVVRKGNPKGIHDWPDLIARDNLRVIAANPKIGGAAKLSFISAWGAIKLAENEAAADRFAKALFNPIRIPSLESSSRTATQTFARKMIGDVHLTWESEAVLELRELADEVEIVRPPRSVLAEPHVAVVDAHARRHGTEAVAADYVRFLYTEQSQKTIASHGFRAATLAPDPVAAAMRLFRVSDVMSGGWPEAQKRFFDDGGLFDQSYH